MEPSLEATIALLERTPAALTALVHNLPEDERADWLPRVRMILEDGEKRVFDPLDRWGFERDMQDKGLRELLGDFATLRASNLSGLREIHLGARELALRGTHPALGAVTLAELLATWATHDLTHLHQVSRVLAHQYRAAVGPWARYLGVLRCQGHSE